MTPNQDKHFPMTANRCSHFSSLSPLTKPWVAVSRQPDSPQLGMCLYLGDLRLSPTYWCDSSHSHRHSQDLCWWLNTYKASDLKTYKKKPCPSFDAISFPALHMAHSGLNSSHFLLHKKRSSLAISTDLYTVHQALLQLVVRDLCVCFYGV